MVQMIGQICEQRMLPKFTIPYFSDDFHAEETWLSSVTFPPLNLDHGLQKQYLPPIINTIPPYNIRHYIQLHDDTYEHNIRSDRVKASSRITAMMIMGELSSINRSECYTHFLEYHLLAYAKYFQNIFDQGQDGFPPVLVTDSGCHLDYIAQWFSYAYSSTKILVGLWTLCYLHRRLKPTWNPPAGFCSGAISFLEV
jgi:hypothetical protein